MVNGSLTEEYLAQAVDLLSMTTVVAIFYTLVFMLYCLSFRLSYAQLWDDHGKIKRQPVCTLVFATVLLICATLDVIVRNRIVQVIYIDNSTVPGGPLSFPAVLSAATLVKLKSIVNALEELLILGVLLSRVQVIWSGTRFVMLVTIVSLLLYLANAGLMISYIAIAWKPDPISLAATPRSEAVIFMLASVFSLANLLFMTTAIIARLLFIRQKHIKYMGKCAAAGQYFGIAAMFIESYALDTLWSIGMLISFGLKYTPTTNLFGTCTTQVDILTNFLLICRVLSRQAWNRQTQNNLSTLNCGRNGTGTINPGTVDLREANISEENPAMISFTDSV